jgi:antirestriction protein ArdC
MASFLAASDTGSAKQPLSEYYADRESRFTSAARGSGEAHGIIRGAALCALCRYRHNAHWTAKADRCNRELGKRFGDNAYSMEELIAELTAAFTLAHMGLSSEPRPDHAQYIASWLKVLKADTRAIFTAASKAQQAADYIVRESGSVAEVAA